jgi:TatD DNase family protein
MFIDTHCHLFSEEFDADRIECIDRAQKAGISKILLPNIDSSTIERLYSTEKNFSDICFSMMGLHPTSVKENYQQELEIVYQELSKRKFAGIGEIGIDLYWDKTFLKEQKFVFQKQLEWALQFNYPVSIHCREAFDEIFEVLDNMQEIPFGIFHCFTGTLEQAQKILSYNRFKLGIGGVLTYKKSTLPDVLKFIDKKHLVIETDAPYLAPVPYRGKRNEPAYLYFVAEKLAEIKNTTIEEIARATHSNSTEIFKTIQ